MKIEPTNLPNSPVQPSKLQVAKAPAAETAVTSPVQPNKDIVEISVPAQARQLQQQGQTVDQIALKLNLSAQVVNQYLGLVGQKQG